MQDVNVMDGIVGETRCDVKKGSNVKTIILLLFILSFILWIISHFHNISWVWILSPFWEIIAIIAIGIILVILSTIGTLIIQFFKYLKEKK